MEKEILGRFETLPEVRELHLITGKFDLLVALESEDIDLDPATSSRRGSSRQD